MNRSTVMKGLAAAVSVVVIASLAGAAYVLGSPAQRRQIRLDERRLKDLVEIADSVQGYAKKHDALPQNFAALQEAAETEAGKRRPPADPDTRAPYEYKVLDAQSWQLCAVFSLPSPDENENDRTYYGNWRRAHDAGRQCFKYSRDNDGGNGGKYR
ncbi:MAG: hypothetical protein LBI48_12505 [Burkholderiaceae bacterium]|jgi:hypothetical protein|nr:hypothetical protein [Burkholderiaceae bacterium]